MWPAHQDLFKKVAVFGLVFLLSILIIGLFKIFSTSTIVHLKNAVVKEEVQFFKPSPTPSPPPSIMLRVTGDVLLARTVNQKMHNYHNFNWPFAQTQNFLAAADITLINLENPIVDECPIQLGGFIFCGPPTVIAGLKTAGIDIAGLANNHMANYGIDGVKSTQKYLSQNNIGMTGLIDQPINYQTVKNKTIAFVAFNDVGTQAGVLPATEEQIKKQISTAIQNSQFVVAFFHWGNEYQTQPSPRQRELAKLAVDNGADLVLGNHPHWWQPSEKYQNKLIVYSHGNFVFDQMWSEETKTGLVGTYSIDTNNQVTVTFDPIYIKDYGQPELLTGDKRDKVLADLEKANQVLSAHPLD